MAPTTTARLAGKVALVTGAARGQGRSHAVRFAEEGADVVAIDLEHGIGSVRYPLGTPAELEETAAQVRALGRRVVTAIADVRDEKQLTVAVDAAVAELGGLDVVCANAGITSAAPATAMTAEQWRDVLDVNLTGVFHTVRVAVPHLRAAGGGSVVIVNSAAGLRAYRNLAHYTAAKHGLVGLMRNLALELGEDWIRVNSVHPTGVDTPMMLNDDALRLYRPDLENPTRDDVAPVFSGVHALPVPWVEPVDVSNAVVFLASDEARYITGASLPVDAGRGLT
ncbi:mycofactocin-coupled SDR family oxidoreductase [Pseudonocardia ailaonensis]|uniref:Mycofactocin-coupled SDR family oxidoreductase n=1 Tax=Pseudonocardia ailaonensis TaxID=367279 RepID=A0ABN2MYE5_9PSEU